MPDLTTKKQRGRQAAIAAAKVFPADHCHCWEVTIGGKRFL